MYVRETDSAENEAGVKYLRQDWQGSTRAVVGNTGNVQSRSDYTAFGEKINSSTGLRTSTQGFGKSSSLRDRYALTEKDDATGLDHTWFRKHENQAGRWTSPDPYNGSMSLGDPQSFNRYSYVENDPVNWVDPSGLNMAGPNTRYSRLDPMGAAYYVDGMLTDAWHAWGLINSGAGYIAFHDVGGLNVVNSWEQRRNPSNEQWEYRNFTQTVHFFGNGIGNPIIDQIEAQAREILKNNKACRELLSSRAYDVRAVLSGATLIASPDTPSKYIAWTNSTWLLSNGSITFYQDYFSDYNVNVGKTTANDLGLSLNSKRLLTFFHELGHLTRKFIHGGVGPVPVPGFNGNVTEGQLNELVYNTCLPK